MADHDFAITVLQAQRGLAVKKRTRSAHGKVTKSDPTLANSFWRIARVGLEADVDRIVRFLRHHGGPRQDLATVHGDPAPGVDPNHWVRRLSAESHGSNRTTRRGSDRSASFRSISTTRRCRRAARSATGRTCSRLAEFARETFLPPALRDVDLAIAAASSTGFKDDRLSLHAYAVLDRSVPLAGDL